MRSCRVLGGVIFISLLVSCAYSEEGEKNGKSIPVDGYELVWSDDFNGDALDKTKWSIWRPGLRRGAINTDGAVTLDGQGHLVLTTSRVGNKIYTGGVWTKDKFERAFGYFECRVRLQEPQGHWSAFWLMCPTAYKGNPSVNGAEIDIFEHPYKDAVEHNVHWEIRDKVHKKASSGNRSLAKTDDGYHTFGLEWTAEKYVFFIDGKKSWELSKGVSHKPEFMTLSLEVGKWAGDISKAKLPDQLHVDYVRVYEKRGGCLWQNKRPF